MLALPEFDTYGILPGYAKNPKRGENKIALALLKQAVSRHIIWDVICAHKPGIDLQTLLNVRVGMDAHEETQTGGRVSNVMSKAVSTLEEREKQDSFYLDMLKLSGLDANAIKDRLTKERQRKLSSD